MASAENLSNEPLSNEVFSNELIGNEVFSNEPEQAPSIKVEFKGEDPLQIEVEPGDKISDLSDGVRFFKPPPSATARLKLMSSDGKIFDADKLLAPLVGTVVFAVYVDYGCGEYCYLMKRGEETVLVDKGDEDWSEEVGKKSFVAQRNWVPAPPPPRAWTKKLKELKECPEVLKKCPEVLNLARASEGVSVTATSNVTEDPELLNNILRVGGKFGEPRYMLPTEQTFNRNNLPFTTQDSFAFLENDSIGKLEIDFGKTVILTRLGTTQSSDRPISELIIRTNNGGDWMTWGEKSHSGEWYFDRAPTKVRHVCIESKSDWSCSIKRPHWGKKGYKIWNYVCQAPMIGPVFAYGYTELPEFLADATNTNADVMDIRDTWQMPSDADAAGIWEKCEQIFETIDSDRDSALSKAEFSSFMIALQPDVWTDKKIESVLSIIDLNCDDSIDLAEFVRWTWGFPKKPITFRVTIKDAHLYFAEFWRAFDTVDPYARIYVDYDYSCDGDGNWRGDEIGRTKPVNNSNEPNWDAEFEICISAPGKTRFGVTIWDSNWTSDVMLAYSRPSNPVAGLWLQDGCTAEVSLSLQKHGVGRVGWVDLEMIKIHDENSCIADYEKQ